MLNNLYVVSPKTNKLILLGEGLSKETLYKAVEKVSLTKFIAKMTFENLLKTGSSSNSHGNFFIT